MRNLTRWVGALALALLILLVPATAFGQSDQFASNSDSVAAPSRHGSAITPSDSADLTRVPKAIYVGVGGDVTMIGVDAPAGAVGITFKSVPAGSIIPFRPRRVLASGTTAALMLALY